eukprot:COSAG01_NODE_23423_length_811_cov_78.696927_2_plen_39_part_01
MLWVPPDQQDREWYINTLVLGPHQRVSQNSGLGLTTLRY